MSYSLAELGNKLRCPLKGCDNFGKIIKLAIKPPKVELTLVCEKHGKKYKVEYTVGEFIFLAENALIEKEWIVDFQRKNIIMNGQFISIKGGLDGVFVVKNKELISKLGKKLICKCGSIAHATFVKVKGDQTVLNLYCAECMPKGKKVKFKSADVIKMAQAGLIDYDIAKKVKDAYTEDNEDFDVEEAWGGWDTMMASWVKEELGMTEEHGGMKKCYICGAIVPAGVSRCPKCGMDLD